MINVMYSSDDNYLRHAAASICSLLENSNGDDITIHFVSNKLSKKSKSALEKLVTKYNQKIIYFCFQNESKCQFYKYLIRW